MNLFKYGGSSLNGSHDCTSQVIRYQIKYYVKKNICFIYKNNRDRSLLGYWVVELEQDNRPATNRHLAHGREFRSFYKTFAAVLKQSTVVFHINKSFFYLVSFILINI